jgi:CBS domain-containing protein
MPQRIEREGRRPTQRPCTALPRDGSREATMNVADILKQKPSRIVTVRQNESVAVAAMIMKREGIGGLLVKDVVRTEGNTPLGMFTERDIVYAIVEHGAAALEIPVGELMTKKIISCSPQDDLARVKQLMTQHRIRHLPVFEGEQLIGVVGIRDVIAVEAEAAAPSAAAVA